MPSTQTQVSIRINEETEAWLDDRTARYMTGSRAAQLSGDIALLRTLLNAETRRLRLTLNEARCLAAIVGGDLIDHTVGLILHSECVDAFRLARQADPTGGDVSSYASQFGIDEQHLLDRLAALGPAGDLAVRDALSRWWHQRPMPEDDQDEATTFRNAGLTITDEPSSVVRE